MTGSDRDTEDRPDSPEATPENPGALVLRSVLRSAARQDEQGDAQPVPRPGENPGASVLRSVLRSARPRDEVPLLTVADLGITLPTRTGPVSPVTAATFAVARGETVGLVGESGSGKSLTAMAIMGLLPRGALVRAWDCALEGIDLLTLRRQQIQALRGDRMTMIFQEPMTALNPVMTVGDQVAEPLRLHRGVGPREAWDRAVEMLARVGVTAPERRAAGYPHELSGGMRQRVLIAMALITEPALLIADEPTTALDVTVQRQIVELLLEMQASMGMGVLFISHNLDLVSEVAGTVAVMRQGRVVEIAPTAALFEEPLHPYTRRLMAAIPRLGLRGRRKSPRLDVPPEDPAERIDDGHLRPAGPGRFVFEAGAAA